MTTTEISREEDHGLSLQELMMLPVILLWLTFQAVARHVVKLKELRRTRPMPRNWQEHWPNLRLAEWHIRELTASGVEQILSGKDLDLHQLSMDPDPLEDFGQMPASAWEMHRRFEAIARFHADPERYIRRAAQRIFTRDGEIDPLGRAEPGPPPPPSPPPVVVMVVVMVVVVFLSATGFSAQRIRAPPWLILNRKNKSLTNPPTRSARTRDHAQRNYCLLPALYSLLPAQPRTIQPHGLRSPILVYRPIAFGLPEGT